MKQFAIQFLNFQRENGLETDPSSNVFIFDPPKKVERSREQDQLLIYMIFSGNASPDNINPSKLAQEISDHFYNSPGSLTFALKSAVQQINTYLVDENLRSTSKGSYRFGCIVLFNLRDNLLYIVQAGPTQVYQLGAEVKSFHDSNLAGKGLGISPSPKMFFAQAKLEDGDSFLVSVEQPKEWEQAVATLRHGTTLESIKRRLLGVTKEDLIGLLVSYGSRTLQSVEPNSVFGDASPANHLGVEVPFIEQVGRNEGIETPLANPKLKSENRTRNSNRRRTIRKPAALADLSGLAAPILGVLQQARSFKNKVVEQLETTLFKLGTSNQFDQPLKLASNRIGLLVAIILPILVLIVAQLFYSNIGYDAKYTVYIDHAKTDIAKAASETKEEIKRVDWQSALSWIEKAELSSANLDPEAAQLKQLAQDQLDLVNKVVRVNYVPAMSATISAPYNISRMVASDSDIYFLDIVQNKVLRASYNGSSYDMDLSFKCGPEAVKINPEVPTEIGRLVEILPLVRSTNNSATLLAIDENAHLLYCSPGGEPATGSLTIPDQGIKQITSVALFDHALYVLDSVGGAVWYYQGDLDWQFVAAPSFFFASQIPVGLDQAKSIAVSGDDLYILFKDGHLSYCQYSRSEIKETQCDDPKLFVETRAGYTGGEILGDGVLTQLAITLPPSTTVLFLEPNSQSVYNFSQGSMELQNHIRTKIGDGNLLPKNQPIQLMTVSPNKLIYLLVGGQVYTSTMNP